MRDNHPLAITRKRAHSILLSHNGYHIPYITEILGVCRQSIALWVKKWDVVGLLALIEDTRSGRPRKLAAEEEQKVITKIKDSPRSIKKIIAEIADKTGISIGKETLRRICKRAGLKWKRIKKTLKNEKAYQEALDNFSELLKKEKQGKIEVFYFDETKWRYAHQVLIYNLVFLMLGKRTKSILKFPALVVKT
jgi:transposase